MNLTSVYLLLSVAMAALMITEAYLLKKNQGKFQGNIVLSAISLLEFVWLVTSSLALYHLYFYELTIVVPAIYIIHNISGWAYGMYLFKKEGIVKQLETGDEDNIAIPKKLIDFTLSFGMVFLVAAVAALVVDLQYNTVTN